MAQRRRRTAAEFICRHPELSPEELVRLAAEAGFEITPKLVLAVRVFQAHMPAPVPRARATPQIEPPPESQRRVAARAEKKFVELAQEIGFTRAKELLDLVEPLLRDDPEAGSSRSSG